MPARLLIGTHNPARIEMVREILRGTGIAVISLREIGIAHEVDEDGPTTEANAMKKARDYFALSGIPTLAMDGGLRVDRFPPEKQPGVLVKRQVGQGATHLDLLDYYVQTLAEVGGTSPGTWTASQALAVSAGRVLAHTYTFDVLFTTERQGEAAPGHALDSIMIDPASGRYYTGLPMTERPYYRATREFLLEHLDCI